MVEAVTARVLASELSFRSSAGLTSLISYWTVHPGFCGLGPSLTWDWGPKFPCQRHELFLRCLWPLKVRDCAVSVQQLTPALRLHKVLPLNRLWG